MNTQSDEGKALGNADPKGCGHNSAERNYMIGERIAKLEKFFGVKKPQDLNPLEWLDVLYEMELDWEEEHQQPFPHV